MQFSVPDVGSITNIPLHILYHSIRIRTAHPVSVRVRVNLRLVLVLAPMKGCISHVSRKLAGTLNCTITLTLTLTLTDTGGAVLILML